MKYDYSDFMIIRDGKQVYSTPELSQLHPGLENGLHANGALYPLEVDILDVLFSHSGPNFRQGLVRYGPQ